MKRNLKLLSLLLALLLYCSLFTGCLKVTGENEITAPPDVTVETTEETTAEITTESPESTHYDFIDDCVYIVIHAARETIFSPEDFPEVDCIRVNQMMKYYRSCDEHGEGVYGVFLTLSEKSHENVLRAIELLKAREDVCSADPSYPLYPD